MSTLSRVGRAWERCCSGRMPCLQKQVLVLCSWWYKLASQQGAAWGGALPPSLHQPLPSWLKKQQVGEETQGRWWGRMCPALWMGLCTQLPLKGHPTGVWVGCRCSPPQPSHPLDRLGALQRGITHHRQLLRQWNDMCFLQQNLWGPGRPLLSLRTWLWWGLAVTRAGTPGVGGTSSPALYPP